MNNDELMSIAFSIATGKKLKHWREDRVTKDQVLEWVDTSFGPLPTDKYAAGGFVFGQLQAAWSNSCDCNGKRKTRRHRVKDAVLWRSAITLDADYPHRVKGFLEKVRAAGWDGLIYTSASATLERPKYRLIIWTDRTMTPDEYWFVAKQLMNQVGASAFDPSAAQAERLMYRPAAEDPEAFFSEVLEGEPVDVDESLELASMLGLAARGEADNAEADVDSDAWLAGLPGADESPCRALLEALDAAREEFAEVTEGGRHDIALIKSKRLVFLADEGHRGILAALDSLEGMFEEAIAGDRDVEVEWRDLVARATRQVAARETRETERVCCLSAPDVFAGDEERDPFAVLTGHVTKGLGNPAAFPIKQWKTETTAAVDLAAAILSMRWTMRGESGDEDCKILRTWNTVPYEWHRTHWEKIPPDHLAAEVKRILDAAVTPKRNPKTGTAVLVGGKKVWKPIKVTPNFLSAVVRLIELSTIVHARLGSGHWIDCTTGRCPVGQADRRYVSFRNGILDLESRYLVGHESAFFNTYSLGFDHDPAAECPFWEETLENWLPGDKESQDCLEEIVGYLILGGMEMDKMFVFLGKPRAGKGTVMRIVKAMLGSGFSAQALDEMGDRFGKEDLIGKRVVHITEAVGGPGARKVVSTMKAVSGRDEGAEVKIKGGKSVQVDFECRFCLTGNEDLELPDSSGVIADRIVALFFGQSFLGREDRGLDAKLAAEYSGIFNRVWVAYDRLMKRGKFTQPASGQQIIDNIRRSAAPGKTWFAETFDVTGLASDVVTLEAAVDHYEANCPAAVPTPLGKAPTKNNRDVTTLARGESKLTVERINEVGDDGKLTGQKITVIRGLRFKKIDD